MGLATEMVAICTQLGRNRLQEQGRGARWTSPCWLLRDNVCLQQDDEVRCCAPLKAYQGERGRRQLIQGPASRREGGGSEQC